MMLNVTRLEDLCYGSLNVEGGAEREILRGFQDEQATQGNDDESWTMLGDRGPS